MKKLISAASALVMAATMVSAAVPFATGAADASKGLLLKPYVGKDGKAVSTEITEEQINAGDVTIPVALYFVENTKDTKSFTANWTVNTTDGDASNKYVSFKGYFPNAKYFTTPQKTTYKGTDYDMSRIVGFAGEVFYDDELEDNLYKTACKASYNIAEKQDSLDIKNAWGSVVWTQDGKTGYTYTGEKSDSFPVLVFDVTFAKGTPAGTYTIDLIDKVRDPKFPEVYSTMVECLNKYAPANNNLDTSSVTIKIGGKSDPQPPVTTTTAPVTPPTTTTTTPSGDPGLTDPSKLPVMDDFIVAGEEYTVKPGDTIDRARFRVEKAGGHKASTLAFEIDPAQIPAGFTLEVTNTTVYAIDHTPSYSATSNVMYNAYTAEDGTNDPVPVNEGKACCQFEIKVADTVAPGKYEIGLKRFQVVEKAQTPKIEFLATVKPIVINVEGDVPATTTTAKDDPIVTTTTKAAAPITTTTTKTPDPTGTGKVLYGDANDNGVVDICDVVVLNRALNNDFTLTAQGKINADCCDAKGGEELNANDSDAIIKSIVELVTLPCTSAQLG